MPYEPFFLGGGGGGLQFVELTPSERSQTDNYFLSLMQNAVWKRDVLWPHVLWNLPIGRDQSEIPRRGRRRGIREGGAMQICRRFCAKFMFRTSQEGCAKLLQIWFPMPPTMLPEMIALLTHEKKTGQGKGTGIRVFAALVIMDLNWHASWAASKGSCNSISSLQE